MKTFSLMRSLLMGSVLSFLVGCESTNRNPTRVSVSPASETVTALPRGDFLVRLPAERASYGYVATDPIKVGGPNGPARERRFLDQLAGPKGKRITYRRLGSCCAFSTPNGYMGTGLLDQYEVRIAGDPEPKKIFINMYDFETPRVPQGFTVR